MRTPTSPKLILDSTEDVRSAGSSSSVHLYVPEEHRNTGGWSSEQFPDVGQEDSLPFSEYELEDFFSALSSTHSSSTSSTTSPHPGNQLQILDTPLGIACIATLSSNLARPPLSPRRPGSPALQLHSTFSEVHEGDDDEWSVDALVETEESEDGQSTQDSPGGVLAQASSTKKRETVEEAAAPGPSPTSGRSPLKLKKASRKEHIRPSFLAVAAEKNRVTATFKFLGINKQIVNIDLRNNVLTVANE
ncbi:hypothetical protein PYCCODRAFT_1473391 [Trametes coccinea BRFM310]|uniref:Uncharacterized protein n=1 Tax=Trametes coccinea (strain BRFM310) TaxID=1353009 RepID=A0A1Y2J490_TRAC3|nr:hypothetical protein PYCCODRAFT_1473391 [Trametes coccinea BRFM310]